MKKYQYFFITLVLLSGAFTSCNDKLNEEPKSQLLDSFFKTEQGIEGAVINGYSSLRGVFPGNSIGTDCQYTSDAVGGWEKSPDNYDALLAPSHSPGSWSFTTINSLNGVLQFGADIDMSEARKTVLFAETRFLRALFYFRMVQSFGKVPLDLGSGKLVYNNTPSTLSERAPVADVYEVIISDLLYAVANLPLRPAQEGRVTKKVALHLLSKVYLTRATTEAGQSTDYAKAFEYANELIQNKETYGTELMRDYGMIHSEETDKDSDNPEVLLRVQYKPNSTFGSSQSASWTVTAGYENCRVAGIAVVPRSIKYQRPWRMYVPTPYTIWTAFADKTNDSRWDNSFRMIWECGVDNEDLKSLGINEGDPGIVLYFEGDDISAYPANCVKYKVEDLYTAEGLYKNSAVNYMYPSLFKFDDTKNRVSVNEACYRPLIAYRLGETYLIAAEALIMQGKKSEALPYINAIRKRAAYRPGLSDAELAAVQSTMEITDPDVLDIDFILDELIRELYGEQPRYAELVRTGKLLERVKAYNPHGAPNIQEYHMLRPIPQTQIDLMTDPEQKATYQNPGYK